ncbi:MAG: RloB domain-containing protein [Eubacteriales bacterium]|nr:RloB domain-containing protein [Eubacteriales bacterium]
MSNMKENRTYTFSVEGNTEQWYLYRLQELINQSSEAKYRVKFNVKVEQSPLRLIKSINSITMPSIIHLCDIESQSEEHEKKFKNVLDEMKEVQKQKNVKYYLGYCNYTFDLWMVLHKKDCKTSFIDSTKYLKEINDGYDMHFISLDQYKTENNFNKCLSKISLKEVHNAIDRAEKIMNNNSNIYKVIEYKKYSYYQENPSLTIWKHIKNILKECGIL